MSVLCGLQMLLLPWAGGPSVPANTIQQHAANKIPREHLYTCLRGNAGVSFALKGSIQSQRNLAPCKHSNCGASPLGGVSCAPRKLHLCLKGLTAHPWADFLPLYLAGLWVWQQVNHFPLPLPHCLLRALADCQMLGFTRSIVPH